MTKRFGFTLAEVLITLAIIGVVAVLTVPTLITNNQEKGWNTASTVFEAKLEQALKVMNTQGTLAGYTTTRAFVDELSNHLKIVKVCDNDKLTDCFSDKVYWGGGEAAPEEVDITTVKTAKNFGQDKWSIDTEVLGFQLNNGTMGLIAYNPDCTQNQFSNEIEGTDCVAVLYDTSGFSKPNTSGKDIGAIHVESLGSKCAFEVDGACYGAPFKPTAHVWNACDTNGVTTDPEDLAFMSKYGIKYCMTSTYGKNDYWAGAVEACGGVQNLPSMAQLAEMANYVYNTSGVQAKNDKYNVTMNTERATSLGFNSSRFSLWSKEEYAATGVYDRSFYSNYTLWYTNRRRDQSGEQAVCIAN